MPERRYLLEHNRKFRVSWNFWILIIGWLSFQLSALPSWVEVPGLLAGFLWRTFVWLRWNLTYVWTKRMEKVFWASDSLSDLWPVNKWFTYLLMASNGRRLTGDLGNRGGEYDDWHRGHRVATCMGHRAMAPAVAKIFASGSKLLNTVIYVTYVGIVGIIHFWPSQ